MGWGVKPEKQAQMFFSTLICAIVIFSMIGCMFLETATAPVLKLTDDFATFFVKFPCCIALHLELYPEVGKGMELMKLSNNYPFLFVPWGSNISFLIGFIQVFGSLLTEFVNIYLLINIGTVEYCIIYFVSLKIIMKTSELYF